MQQNIIYTLCFFWGVIDKLGDDAIDIHHFTHGSLYMEFFKIIRIILLFILLSLSGNIWLYLFIFIYAYNVMRIELFYPYYTKNEYVSDPYITSSSILFTLLSVIYIYYHYKEYHLVGVAITCGIAAIACSGFITDILSVSLRQINPQFYNSKLTEEIGPTKIVIRLITICVNIICMYLSYLYVKPLSLQIACIGFLITWSSYFFISVVTQTYILHKKKYLNDIINNETSQHSANVLLHDVVN